MRPLAPWQVYQRKPRQLVIVLFGYRPLLPLNLMYSAQTSDDASICVLSVLNITLQSMPDPLDNDEEFGLTPGERELWQDNLPTSRQFQIWDVALVMLVVGGLCGVTRLLPWHSGHGWFYLTYFGAFGMYLTLRLPSIVRSVRLDARRMQARKRRILSEARRQAKARSDDSSGPDG